jgi:hypothetical protein
MEQFFQDLLSNGNFSMTMSAISEMQLLTGWITCVGCAYLYLDFRHRFRKQKEKPLPKQYKQKSDRPL